MKETYLQIKYIIGRPSWWIGTLISFIAMMQGFISEGIYQSKNLIYMMTVTMNYFRRGTLRKRNNKRMLLSSYDTM